MSLYDRIPNNVNLSEDTRLQRALEKWLPYYLDWWRQMGPDGFQENDVYLRTAVSVEPSGWAHLDYVRMPDNRWGIFLTQPGPEAKIGLATTTAGRLTRWRPASFEIRCAGSSTLRPTPN